MDPATLIGIVLAVASLLFMMIMEGSSPMAIVLLPAMVLVFGGTFGAAIAGSAMADVKKIGGWFKQALLPAKVPPVSDRIATLVSLAEKARKEGLLALEAQVKDIDDPFLKRGLQMGIDGTDPEELRAVLEGEISAKKAEDKVGAKFFTAMGGYAPTIGIIGTRRRPDPRAGEPRQARVARPADRRARSSPRSGACCRPTSSGPAHGRQDHADQRAAGRPDGAARRGHHRDPGRHQPARGPPEAHLPRARRARSQREAA